MSDRRETFRDTNGEGFRDACERYGPVLGPVFNDYTSEDRKIQNPELRRTIFARHVFGAVRRAIETANPEEGQRAINALLEATEIIAGQKGKVGGVLPRVRRILRS